MMNFQLTPYLMLNGTAKEAVQFYQKVLGAEVVFIQTFGEGPEEFVNSLSSEEKGRIAHSVLKIGDSALYVGDVETRMAPVKGNQIMLCITTRDVKESQRLYELLQKEGGVVNQPLQSTYFSPSYGVVTDRFGVTFQVFTRK
ncbi:VOC family protein [Paenibacillus tuaregi]|uniref:VOC family protein n=1 Tax=Paenibacillus tuaregi TaxID=1816681 RepID=UPI00292A4056|nr:VOC family protein [Paenibacillus tuaregi]